MSIFRHIYYAIRYGEWEYGWDKDDWSFSFGHVYYDGYWVECHIYKFWFLVRY